MIFIYTLEQNGTIFYVGKTKGLNKRKNAHCKKYGTNITMNLLDEVPNNEWKFWEKYWISQIKTWGFDIVNKNSGGGGPEIYSEESKAKMRKSHPGVGIKISKKLIENNHSKYYTNDIRDKMSKSQINISKPFSNNHKLNMGIAKLKDAKPVIQLDLENNPIKEWESKGLAAKWIKELTGKTSNITSQIKDCILGRQKTAFGFKWKYK